MPEADAGPHEAPPTGGADRGRDDAPPGDGGRPPSDESGDRGGAEGRERPPDPNQRGSLADQRAEDYIAHHFPQRMATLMADPAVASRLNELYERIGSTDPEVSREAREEYNRFYQSLNSQTRDGLRHDFLSTAGANEPNRELEELAARRGEDPETVRRQQELVAPGGGWEVVKVRTEVGYTRDVLMPKDDREKVKYFRDLLGRIEETKEEQGGLAVRQRANDMQQVIESYLTRPEYDPTRRRDEIQRREDPDLRREDPNRYRNLGERFYEELIARNSFNQIYTAFDQAGGKEQVQNTLTRLRHKHLRTMLTIREVQAALAYLEVHADEYLDAQASGDLDNFRRKAIAQIPEELPDNLREKLQREGVTAQQFKESLRLETRLKYMPKVGDPKDLDPNDLDLEGNPRPKQKLDEQWAIRLAERLWEVMGRKAVRDRVQYYRVGGPHAGEIIDQKTVIGMAERAGMSVAQFVSREINENRITTRFKAGTYSLGGMYYARRVLRFNGWAETNINVYRIHTELLEGFDFGTRDYISFMAAQVERLYISKLYLRYLHSGRADPYLTGREEVVAGLQGNKEASMARARAGASVAVSKMFGGLEKIPKKGKEAQSLADLEQEADKRHVSLEQVRREKIEIGEGKFYNLDDLEWPKFLRDADEEDSLYNQREDQSDKEKDYSGIVANIDWDMLSEHLNAQGEYPMSYWTIFHLVLPEAARSELSSEGKDKFLNHPTTESLTRLKDVFVYQSADQYKSLGTLLNNFVHHIRSKEHKREFGEKADPLMVETALVNVGRNFNLTSGELNKMLENALGGFLLKELKAGYAAFRPNKFLLQFFLNLIYGIIKSGLAIREIQQAAA
ncbi:hypothetical protein HYS93_01130 [Candidatus Daviesbacteria bacterium]|nr:hypothetical protein [Candidatus Daviesbacteria bacterium]